MFICTLDLKTYKKLKAYGAKYTNEVKMKDKIMYVFLFDKDIYDQYNEKYKNRNIFLTDKLFFV